MNAPQTCAGMFRQNRSMERHNINHTRQARDAGQTSLARNISTSFAVPWLTPRFSKSPSKSQLNRIGADGDEKDDDECDAVLCTVTGCIADCQHRGIEWTTVLKTR